MYGVQQGGGSKSGIFCVRNIWMAPYSIVSKNRRSLLSSKLKLNKDDQLIIGYMDLDLTI